MILAKSRQKLVSAFYAGQTATVNKTSKVENYTLKYHNSIIAKIEDGYLWITNDGFFTVTTKERLNMLSGVSIQEKKAFGI